MPYKPISEATRQLIFAQVISGIEVLTNDIVSGGAVNQGEIDEIISHAKQLRDAKPPAVAKKDEGGL
jgi:hypothetical protein